MKRNSLFNRRQPGSLLGRIVRLSAFAAASLMLARSIPDFVRYLRIRRM